MCLHSRRFDPWVWSLGQKDPLKKGMATHSSILAWGIPWTEEPGGLQFMGLQRVGHDWAFNDLLLSPNSIYSCVFRYVFVSTLFFKSLINSNYSNYWYIQIYFSFSNIFCIFLLFPTLFSLVLSTCSFFWQLPYLLLSY